MDKKTKRIIQIIAGVIVVALLIGLVACSVTKSKKATPAQTEAEATEQPAGQRTLEESKESATADTDETKDTDEVKETEKPEESEKPKTSEKPEASEKPTATPKAAQAPTPTPTSTGTEAGASTTPSTTTPAPQNPGNSSAQEVTPKPTTAPQTPAPQTPKPTTTPAPTPQPTQQPTHTHTWVEQTKTVHHDAEYKTVHHDAVTEKVWVENWVETQAAYDEQVLVADEWTEQVIDYQEAVCECGARFATQSELSAHKQSYFLNDIDGHANGWVDTHYKTVTHPAEYKTVHHDAVYQDQGYYEDKIVTAAYDEQVKVKDAYDETVVTGYKCSGCGATK